ncbi:3'-5' exonuclease [Dispira parvispora]|uniref:RNA exonuclease 4 n=1 Tax=Dispira parvispora TaxID=1520584 RepID=A0A9W8AR74_9FUNG|nr:3'-5' exonuclease [Dispira parvispora]
MAKATAVKSKKPRNEGNYRRTTNSSVQKRRPRKFTISTAVRSVRPTSNSNEKATTHMNGFDSDLDQSDDDDEEEEEGGSTREDAVSVPGQDNVGALATEKRRQLNIAAQVLGLDLANDKENQDKPADTPSQALSGRKAPPPKPVLAPSADENKLSVSEVLAQLFKELDTQNGGKRTTQATRRIGTYLAIDCEMVGVGPDGTESALARVSLVNFHGQVVLDEYVRPEEPVTDYRTEISGISSHHLEGAPSFQAVQIAVSKITKDRVLVGHALDHDLKALLLSHPRHQVRDTAYHPRFRKLVRGKTPALKFLAHAYFGITIQDGSHSSVEDAQAAMLVYRKFKAEMDSRNRKPKQK